jgi:hypothetical protein
MNDRLIVDRVLVDDVTRLLERASEEAALFALPWTPFPVTGQCT